MGMEYQEIDFSAFWHSGFECKINLLNSFHDANPDLIAEVQYSGALQAIFTAQRIIIHQAKEIGEILTGEQVDALSLERREVLFSFSFGRLDM